MFILENIKHDLVAQMDDQYYKEPSNKYVYILKNVFSNII